LAKSDKNLRQVDAMIGEPITIEFDNNRLLAELYGEHGKNLARIEHALGVSIANRGNQVFVSGDAAARARAELVLNTLYHQLETGGQIGGGDVDGAVRLSLGGVAADEAPADQPRRLDKLDSLRTNRREVVARSTTQAAYIKALLTSEMVVGTGPAGTGKTYLGGRGCRGHAGRGARRPDYSVAPLRSRLARAWAFCPAICATRSTLICARFTTRFMTCCPGRK
jgi:phosphate starvation-inducible protein PhoH